jgi:hypothetical protein
MAGLLATTGLLGVPHQKCIAEMSFPDSLKLSMLNNIEINKSQYNCFLVFIYLKFDDMFGPFVSRPYSGHKICVVRGSYTMYVIGTYVMSETNFQRDLVVHLTK